MTDEQRRADRQTGARGDAAPAGHIGHYRERAPEITKERGEADRGGYAAAGNSATRTAPRCLPYVR